MLGFEESEQNTKEHMPKLSQDIYFEKMGQVVFALRDDLRKKYPQAMGLDLIFEDMPYDPLNPRKIFGSAIIEKPLGQRITALQIEGYVGFVPARKRTGYNAEEIYQSVAARYPQTNLLATIEPCDIENGWENNQISILKSELKKRPLKTMLRERRGKIMLGRFHYYVNDEYIQRALHSLAKKISQKLEVLPGRKFSV